MLSDFANSKRPIAALIEFALRQKGATVSPEIVSRYSDLLETAIEAEEGGNIDGRPWAEFVGQISGSKYEGAVRSLALALSASESDIQAFLHVTDAVAAVRAGEAVDAVSATLEVDLAAIPDQPAEAYAHLDQDSQAVKQEVDRALGVPDPSRPEPSHIADDGGEDE
jgi:hypothetical protein